MLGEDYNDRPEDRRFVAVEGGKVVGTLRLTETTQRTMIYGFVIEERQRGRRLGTRLLAAVIDQLGDEGVADVGLEVDPENTPAVRLYERFGFATVTTYRYMRLAITPPVGPGPTARSAQLRRLRARMSLANVGPGGRPSRSACSGGTRRRASSSRRLSSPLRIAQR